MYQLKTNLILKNGKPKEYRRGSIFRQKEKLHRRDNILTG
jgi:hypothetical protein